MPENVECTTCGMTLLGLRATGPEPMAYDECPDCGGTEFAFLRSDR